MITLSAWFKRKESKTYMMIITIIVLYPPVPAGLFVPGCPKLFCMLEEQENTQLKNRPGNIPHPNENPILSPSLWTGPILSACGRFGMFPAFLGSAAPQPAYIGINDSTVTPALQTGHNWLSVCVVIHYCNFGQNYYSVYALPTSQKC